MKKPSSGKSRASHGAKRSKGKNSVFIIVYDGPVGPEPKPGKSEGKKS